MRSMIVAGVLALFVLGVSGASAQAQELKNYGIVQIGTSIVNQSVAGNKAVFGIDFGQDMGHNVQIYLAGGWLQYVDAWHITSGVKFMIPTASPVRPYVRGGLGAIDFHLGDPNADTRFLGEVGAGVAFEVGSQGYIDVGYRRLFQPYDIANFGFDNALKNGLGGVYVGFGFRY